jgi:zinc protease
MQFFWGLLLAVPLGAAPLTHLPKDIDIPYVKFVLSNGLTLLVHEDHKAPIVAVNVWYHVGSKNEKPGKTGFAHLFEHLMFNGSEHFNDDFFKATEKVGATDMNGTTSEDRTNYFEDAPKDALDYLLWLESDRMGHLAGAIDQAKLDEQRGVVQNEKRQGENQPYGLARELLTKGTFPPGHPYSWTVIGSMEDLNAASLEDVKEWFRTYYGAANATLVVAGDVDPQNVRALVEKNFGSIPSGPPIARQEAWIAKRTGTHRQVAQDRVPQARIYKIWNIPEFGTATADYLNLVSDVLSQGRSSRFYKRLVYDDQIATSVSASVDLNEIGGRFFVQATARAGVPLAKVEQALDEELARFLKEGPTAEELLRVKTQNLAGFIRGAERIGGFGGKSDILATYQVFIGDPGNYRETLRRTREATAAQLLEAARAWLTDGAYILEIQPFPAYKTLAKDVDRSKLPVPDVKPEVKFPDLQHTTLANGLKVVLAERHDTPQVSFILLVDAGYAADHSAAPGTAKLAMNMLDQGTQTRTSLEISDELARLGALLNAKSDLDSSSVSLLALKENLEPSLDVYADVILNPAFPPADFKRLQQQQLAAIQREKSEPNAMALRIFPRLLFGPDHPYSTPATGSGAEAAVSKMTREDMRKFYDAWFKPNNATLIVVGDTTLPEIAAMIEKHFATWKEGPTPKKDIGPVPGPQKSVLYLMDRPGSLQSVVFAGELAPPKANPEEIAIETMNSILGGTFTSRINMNLREDKHWSYGARTTLVPARGQRPYLVVAPVQGDKTKEAVTEIDKELQGVRGKQPITPDELAKAQKNLTLTLPGKWETIDAVSRAIDDLVRFRLPDNYYETYSAKVRALELTDVAKAAETVIHPSKLTWVVVGDRAKIEASLRDLGFAEIQLIDTDGKPVP